LRRGATFLKVKKLNIEKNLEKITFYLYELLEK
jgi:hypothetical protein